MASILLTVCLLAVLMVSCPTHGFFAHAPMCLKRATPTGGRNLGADEAIRSHRLGTSSLSSSLSSRGSPSLMMAVGDGTLWDSVTKFFEDLQKGSAEERATIAARAEAEEREKEEQAFEGVWVMMNGLPGKMGYDVAAACLRKGFRVAPYALTGGDIQVTEVTVDDQEGGNSTSTVTLVKSNETTACDRAVSEIKRRCSGGKLIAVDFTHPSAVNSNAEFYAKHQLNFVMGTTGGDREALMSVTEGSGGYAVIAPNMGKQIVGLQTAIDIMAKEFPGSFEGYKLEITESHQSAKADTSGTAKALAADFATLTGEDFDVETITKLREREKQLAFGVPEEHLAGHAFHTYSLKSKDGTVEFQFRHNVCGRRTYADGTADAVEFLAKKAESGAEKKVYNMVDILREGGI